MPSPRNANELACSARTRHPFCRRLVVRAQTSALLDRDKQVGQIGGDDLLVHSPDRRSSSPPRPVEVEGGGRNGTIGGCASVEVVGGEVGRMQPKKRWSPARRCKRRAWRWWRRWGRRRWWRRAKVKVVVVREVASCMAREAADKAVVETRGRRVPAADHDR